jgi:hypothetical protein
MDQPGRRKTIGDKQDIRLQSSATQPVKTTSILAAILFILRQIFDLPATAILLCFGFILPEVKDWITDFGMGKKFDPSRDVGSLEGKVILVTGGTYHSPTPRSQTCY